jgi:hypothetical protein
MQANFERADDRHSYFAASIAAAFKRFFYPRSHVSCVQSAVVLPKAKDPAISEHQNVYQDPDPPTPHWGC